MDKINFNSASEPSAKEAPSFERDVLQSVAKKKRFMKSFFNSAGIFVGVFLMFAVVVLVTVDIRFITFEEAAGLAMNFFLLLFVSYSMYVTCADSGMRAGLISESYKTSFSNFEKEKKYIVASKYQGRLGEFCNWYITEELKGVRTSILAVVGISYEKYTEMYIGADKETIEGNKELSKAQRRAIIKANLIEPIELTPEMIMKRCRGGGRRSPLGIKPETKKKINFAWRFVSSIIIALAISMVVFEAIIEPTWILIATCFIKLLTVVLNGFYGYKFGFENIVSDTVDYMDDQTDLMKQAVRYIEVEGV